MGDRAQEEATKQDNEIDVVSLPAGSRLEKLLADPQTRPIVLRRIAERRKKLAEQRGKASSDKKEGFDKIQQAHGGGEVDLHHKDLANGTISVSRGTKLTASEGGVEHTRDTTTTVGHDKDGYHLSRKVENERAVIEEHENAEGEVEEKTIASVKSAHSKGVSGSITDGKVTARGNIGHEREAQIGAHKLKESSDVSVGLTDGEFAADLKTSRSTESKHGSSETSHSVGYQDGKLTFGSGHTEEKKHKGKGGETETSRSSEGSLSIGLDGVGAEQSWSRTDAKGTKRATTIGAEVGKDGVSASASHSIETKKGHSVTVSIKGGVKVEAKEPEKVGERWVVSYTRTESIGGGVGGKSHGMGANVGVGHDSFTTGTRSFATEKEAKEFKEHAAERMLEDADPHSAAGAMKMAIGESRGEGSSSSGAVGASGSFEGASVGGGLHANKTDELNVKRVSSTVFEVTVHHASEKGGDVHVGGGPITTSASSSSERYDDLTVRFDLSTAEGKQAYEQFCKDRKAPSRGGVVVDTETGKGHTSTDGTKIMGLGSETFSRHTSEKTHVVEDGTKYETYEGDQSHVSSPSRVGRWLGEKKLSDSVEVEASQKNDKATGYTITGHVSGESGAHNRGKMQHLYGRDENWDPSKVKPSGEWTLTTDVDRRTINAMTKYSDRFKGKSQDDQMRALAQWVADDGMNAVNSLERWGDQSLAWDIELKGDKNFPGRAGREAIEARLRSYSEGLAASGSIAPALVPGIESEIATLSARRAAVASTSNYTDLPAGLRQQQLQLIDREIAGFSALLHRAAVEASKNRPGEDVGHIATRAYDAHGYDQAPAEQRPLMQARDQIALNDGLIADAQRESTEAGAALRQAFSHLDLSRPNAARVLSQAGRQATAAQQLDAYQRTQYQQCDTVRMGLLKSTDTARQLTLARGLELELKRTLELAQQAQQQFYEAAKKQILITSAKGLAGHEKFWDAVREDLNEDDYALVSGSSSSDEDEGEEASPPPKPVSMKL